MMREIDSVAEALRARFGPPPEVAVVLGSGLGRFFDALGGEVAPTAAIGLPNPHVPGHRGLIAVGAVRGRRVACLSGRVHLYEGHPPARVVLAVRALARWGVGGLVLTSAVGGLHPEWPPGQVVLITDHLNLQGQNPLTGPNLDALGPRFPDLSRVYSARARGLVREAAAALGQRAPVDGVYAAMPGPAYETPAEIRMLRRLGADVVGMSLVAEAVAAAHAGREVLGLSVVANAAAGLVDHPLSHQEVTEAMAAAGDAVSALLTEVVARW